MHNEDPKSFVWTKTADQILTSKSFVVLLCVSGAKGQGASPETAPPLFPGGGLISYNSIFTTRGLMPESPANVPATARPTFAHEGDINFTWGFYRNFDLTILVPIVTNHFVIASAPTVGGTGLGDVMALVKYRFYRRDSQRGTTQASVTVGPKVPTGRTNLIGSNGILLPASLQPGSGSTVQAGGFRNGQNKRGALQPFGLERGGYQAVCGQRLPSKQDGLTKGNS